MNRKPVNVLVLLNRSLKSDRSMASGLLRFTAQAGHWETRLLDPTTKGIAAVLQKLPETWRPDGIVTGPDGCRILAESPLGRRRDIVRVAIDPPRDAPRRLADAAVEIDETGVAAAAARLLRSRGFRHFGYVGTALPAETEHVEARRKAFLRAAGDGADVRLFRPTDTSFPKWLTELPRLADWLKALPKPCGLFIYNDERASQVLDACRLAHIAVPDQVALLGVDNDSEICENLRPALSSLSPDFEGAGYLAAKILDAVFEVGRRPRRKLRRTYGIKAIVERESTQDVHGAARLVNAARLHLAKHACSGAGVAATALALGVSTRLLELRFRAVTGHTLREEIAARRIDAAKKLLRTTNRTVGDIARASGFGSATALTLAFRRVLATTPGAYRAG